MKRWLLGFIVLAAAASGFLACAELIGADFNVELAPDAGAPDAAKPEPDADADADVAVDASGVQSVAEDIGFPWDIVVDSEWIYWTSGGVAGCYDGAGKVQKRKKSGGEVVDVAVGQNCPNRLALDASYVYWTTTPSGTPDGGTAPGQVLRAPTGVATGPVTPEILATDQVFPIGLDVHDSFVYWATRNGEIKRRWLGADAGDEVLYSSLDAGPGYPEMTHPSLLQTDDAYVYVTDTSEDGGIWKIAERPDSGIGPAILSDGERSPNGIAVGLTDVYFATLEADGGIRSVLKTGGGSAALATGERFPADMVLRDGYLYWAASGEGAVKRLLLPYGAPEIVAAAQGEPNGVAVDESYVYWTVDIEHGAVRKILKPPLR